MMRKIVSIIIFLAVILVTYSGYAQTEPKKAEDNQKNTPFYYSPTKEGWWWYKNYVKPAPKKEEKENKEVATQDKDSKEQQWKPKPLKEYSYEELLYMHPDEFKKIYDYYLKLAVQRPTEENVYEFYNLQDVARKKALLFTHYSGYVWQKYPELSTERDIPIVGPGLFEKAELTQSELRQFARKNAQEYGYIVFVQPHCPYCESQLKILKYAEADGIPIKVVDITKNPSAQRTFAIEVTPTIILVSKKTGQYMPISAGVISLDEIYIRTARAIRMLEGEVPERYGIYEFQKGTSLDPTEPSPLWKKNNKGKEVK